MNSDEVTYSQVGYDLIITMSDGTTVTVHNHFYSPPFATTDSAIELIQFADGVTVDVSTLDISDGTVSGSGGDDVIDASYAGDPDGDMVADDGQAISAGAGNDLIADGAGNDTVYGGDGSDVFMAGGGADAYYGGNGNNDTVSYANSSIGLILDLADTASSTGIAQGDSYAGIEKLIGTGFDDVIIGNDDFAILVGGAGNDDITDGSGANLLRGDEGADIFRFTADGASDRVLDFELGIDTLDLSAWGVTGLDQLSFSENSNGTRLLISFGTQEVIQLDGFTLSDVSDFTAASFIFAADTGPTGDGTVTGTSGDDVIDVAYMGDPDGDAITDGGQIILADAGNDDIYDGAGDDSV